MSGKRWFKHKGVLGARQCRPSSARLPPCAWEVWELKCRHEDVAAAGSVCQEGPRLSRTPGGLGVEKCMCIGESVQYCTHLGSYGAPAQPPSWLLLFHLSRPRGEKGGKRCNRRRGALCAPFAPLLLLHAWKSTKFMPIYAYS